MRRVILLAAIGALGVAGVAYAEATNVYVVTARITPTKSGTAKKPTPISSALQYTVSTSPAGQRPAVLSGYRITVVGIQENTTSFPGCSTSTLISKGPSKCPKGSQVGTGSINALVGPSGNSSGSYSSACRISVPIFNGGHHNLALYIAKTSQPGFCPIPRSDAILVALGNGRSLSMSFSVPSDIRHPSPGIDVGITQALVSVASKTVTRKGKKVGFLASVSCPPNHQRQVGFTFTTEGRVVTQSTANVNCT